MEKIFKSKEDLAKFEGFIKVLKEISEEVKKYLNALLAKVKEQYKDDLNKFFFLLHQALP